MGVEEETTLERELTELLEVERFEPPAEFRQGALLSDPAVYEEAAADPPGLVAAPGDRAARVDEASRARRSTSPTRPSTSGSPTAS